MLFVFLCSNLELKVAYSGLTVNQMLRMIVEQNIDQSGNRLRFPYCIFAVHTLICIKLALSSIHSLAKLFFLGKEV
jgi:hypothetical protein